MALITLTTDFGTQDGYVAAMKGRILSLAPASTLLDLTHDIPPQNLIHAAYCLSRSITEFPSSTIHVVVVDPGVGSERDGLVAQTENGWLVAPDNGVLSVLLDKTPPKKLIRISKKTPHWQAHTSFDGLAVFSPVAAYLANGMALDDVGEVIADYFHLSIAQPLQKKNQLKGEVILFDRFGNAVTNIPKNQLEHKKFRVYYGTQVIPFHQHYQEGETNENQLLAFSNSDSLLELAIFCGSAQKQLNIELGDPVSVEFE